MIRKIIINENQFNKLYTKLTNKEVITEASKLNILTDKIGLDVEQAQILDELCGQFAVWMFNKFLNYQKEIFKSWEKDVPIDEITIEKINDNQLIKVNRQYIQGIMDWIRVGLNGNAKPYKDNTLKELVQLSKEWHDSLGLGEGDINYKEEHPIIKDFRDKDGNGFYWADLETKNSPEECDRMGHCGRSSYGYLYSLRETRPINDKFKINKSHLTAAIGADGIMYQLKGVKNSKPKEEFHQYILPLFYVKNEDDEDLIQGFGTEYASQQDFKLSDLPDEVIRNLYQNRPELFEGRSMQRKLVNMGIIEKPNVDYNIRVDISPSDLGRYIDGDWVLRKYKKKTTTPAGQEYERTIEYTMFEAILNRDTYEMWDSYDYIEWERILNFNIDGYNSEKEIRDILKQVEKKQNPEFNEEEFDEMTTEDIINEYDIYDEVKSAIKLSASDAESDDYSDYLYGLLENAIQEYGTIEKMNSEEIIFHVNMEYYLDKIGEDYFDEYMDRCDDDLDCVFEELVNDGEIDKPEFSPDERWYPSIDDDNLNSILEDRLGLVRSAYKVN